MVMVSSRGFSMAHDPEFGPLGMRGMQKSGPCDAEGLGRTVPAPELLTGPSELPHRSALLPSLCTELPRAPSAHLLSNPRSQRLLPENYYSSLLFLLLQLVILFFFF